MRFLEEMEGLVSNKLGEIKTFISMAKLEAILAGLSIYPLLITLCMVLVILMTTWLSVMLFIGSVIVWFTGKSMIALGTVLLLNSIILGILFRYLWFNLKNMSFEATRNYLSSGAKYSENDNNEPKKKSANGNKNNGTTIA